MRGDSLAAEDVSVEGLFGRVAARHEAQAADLAMVIEPGAELVFGDQFRLEQAVQNLAANALLHPPEDLPFIFNRFDRVDPSRLASGGSGLGLAIVKAIIEHHGGTVSVSSGPSEDTIFTIRMLANGAVTESQQVWALSEFGSRLPISGAFSTRPTADAVLVHFAPALTPFFNRCAVSRRATFWPQCPAVGSVFAPAGPVRRDTCLHRLAASV